MPYQTLDIEIERLVSKSMLECELLTPVSEVVARMAVRRCSSIVVMEQGRGTGIWTQRDALAVGDEANALSRPISALMSHPVLSLAGRTRLGDAVVHFKNKGFAIASLSTTHSARSALSRAPRVADLVLAHPLA